eukprot:TRINITY_DN4141_c2_g1_i1.p1 TRINITY_DN4141_c2_g1~~TRINITY_DN4141_c2_g1_i1.p1  ORF type:complete len:110 (+),score=4.63 TRINITY_DN4141_c2_g1_i1:108-437(+)
MLPINLCLFFFFFFSLSPFLPPSLPPFPLLRASPNDRMLAGNGFVNSFTYDKVVYSHRISIYIGDLPPLPNKPRLCGKMKESMRDNVCFKRDKRKETKRRGYSHLDRWR